MRGALAALRLARWGLLLGLGGCIDAYLPDGLPTTAPRYLVVDGFINGNGRTRIRLSRTVAAGSPDAPPVERFATVTLNADSGRPFTFTEVKPGLYQSDSLVLVPGRRYFLRLVTSNGASYQSASTPLKVTPPIDQLGFDVSGDEVNVRVDTHDDQGLTRYYRWQFTDTWEFNSAYPSYLEYYPPSSAGGAALRGRSTPITTCWRTEMASLIAQGTSVQLGQDALLHHTMRTISAHSERVKIRCSILVSQVAETPEEYAYYDALRKNTEAIGTVNDPLPSQLTGNVRRVGSAANAGEPVIGFVGAHTVQTRRMFIDNAALQRPADWRYDLPYADCLQTFIPLADALDAFSNPGLVPVTTFTRIDTGEEFIIGGTPYCVDCRTRGVNVKPAFW